LAQPDQQSLIFSRLLIEGWRQFDTVDIELHPRLTVLTGANGSGKTTLLGLFAKHFGWRGMYLGTPISNKEGGFSFVVGWVKRLLGRGATPDSHVRIGSLTYSNNVTAAILVPKDAGVQYVVDFNPQHLVSGVQISSNRYMPSYRQVGSIPAIAMLPEMAYQNYFGELVTQNQGGSTGYSPIYRMKEALISMATFGAGNLYVQRNQAVLDSFLGFSEVLKKILPKSLGFWSYPFGRRMWF
jgi:hypothetical protein